MPTEIFVNLTTSDLPRAKKFFTDLGWEINPLFTDDNAACVVIDERIYLMVLTREFFSTFTKKEIPDPRTHSQLQTALSTDSRESVDALIDRAIAAGAIEPKAAQDYGFMYSRDFEDPDGNEFSVFWMDPRASELGPEAWAAAQDGASA
ncbi:glyoxalase [Salinibacterium sp. dk2585]|uniref:VOC family protein n=1 Tax=unclassified Salinibacterium TaxID=2632331 RepID=UPI0011C25289|nr:MULTISPECIES: VOC family protein [unclassified Salinibacterium]QEE61995.1 glyoxalase [Salinibacterium sp. dk2585]TXK54450.1 glyoxalase [Salinibacterium sp. dk5596]